MSGQTQAKRALDSDCGTPKHQWKVSSELGRDNRTQKLLVVPNRSPYCQANVRQDYPPGWLRRRRYRARAESERAPREILRPTQYDRPTIPRRRVRWVEVRNH